MTARTCTSVLLLLVAFFATATVLAEKPMITPRIQTVNVGEDIVIRCELSHAVKAGQNENVQFRKRQTMDGTPLTLSINTIAMDSTYSQRSTIVAIPDSEGHAIGYTLSIAEAITADSGQYGCVLSTGLLPDLSNVVWVNVSISQQIEHLNMYALASNGTMFRLQDGKTYQLTKKESLHLMCEATGSNPEATMSVQLGNLDITDQLFKKLSQRHIEEDMLHMGVVTYNTSLISRDILIVRRPQTVTCRASVEGRDGEMTVSITTFFKHAPIVTCEEVVAFPGEEVTLICNVTANPQVPVKNVTWFLSPPQGNSSRIQGAPYYIETTHMPKNVTHTKLVIDKVFENHFANNYYIIANNTEGSTRMAAPLKKDPKAGGSTSGALPLGASLLLLAVTALWRMQ